MKTTLKVKQQSQGNWHRSDEGFTLIELLIVIAIIAILASMLLPVLHRAQLKAQAIQCMASQRQLAMAWIMYAGDNQGRLARNGTEADQNNITGYTEPSLLTGTNSQWCPGRQDEAMAPAGLQLSPASTPPLQNAGDQWIEAGVLYPYTKNLGVYKCPADYINPYSFIPYAGQQLLHVRSMSMNTWLSPVIPWKSDAPMTCFYTEDSMRVPGPANLWVFIDENPSSINDGSFICDPSNPDWVDYPASYHGNAGCMSFGDGHAEIHRWHDSVVLNAMTTIKQVNGVNPQTPPGQNPPMDLNWLKSVSTIALQ